MPGEVDVKSRRLHAGDAGDVLPVVFLQLAQNKIMAQVDEPDGGLSLPVQGRPGKSGDGLGRQGLVVPVGEDHSLLAPVPPVPQGLEPVRHLPPNGDPSIRQHDGSVPKVDLFPGEVLNLIP